MIDGLQHKASLDFGTTMFIQVLIGLTGNVHLFNSVHKNLWLRKNTLDQTAKLRLLRVRRPLKA